VPYASVTRTAGVVGVRSLIVEPLPCAAGRGLAPGTARRYNLELCVTGEGKDPLLYLERQAYLGATRHAVSGLEAARIVLAKARQHLRDASRAPGH
jgi:hypothetical protein